MAGGFTEYGMEYLQEKLQPFGLTAVNSGGTGASSDKPLEPGSSVGVALMQGDMTLGASVPLPGPMTAVRFWPSAIPLCNAAAAISL